MDGRPESVSLDVQLRTLSAAERREVLRTLATASADDGTGVAVERSAGDSDERLSMHHVHLPKLADTGLVRVDRDSNRVQRGPNFEDIEPLLRAIDDHADELPVDWP